MCLPLEFKQLRRTLEHSGSQGWVAAPGGAAGEVPGARGGARPPPFRFSRREAGTRTKQEGLGPRNVGEHTLAESRSAGDSLISSCAGSQVSLFWF